MNRITATLALIAIFVLTAAAQRTLTTKSQSPVTRTQPLLPATKPLQQLSISFYDFSIEFPGRATINLYDDSRARTATVTLSEDVVDKQFLYSIASPSGDQEWVRVKWEIGATIKYEIMSSAGGSLTIRLTKDIVKSKLKNSRIPIKALAILSEGSSTELQMSDLIGTAGPRRSMLDGAESEEGYGFRESPISQEENKRIFVTPLLGLLRVVLKEFGSLQASSSSERGIQVPRSIVLDVQ